MPTEHFKSGGGVAVRFKDVISEKHGCSKSEADRLCSQGAVSLQWPNERSYPIYPGDELMEPFPAFTLRVGYREYSVSGVMVNGEYVQTIDCETVEP